MEPLMLGIRHHYASHWEKALEGRIRTSRGEEERKGEDREEGGIANVSRM